MNIGPEFRYCCGQPNLNATRWQTATFEYDKLEEMSMSRIPLRNTVSGVVHDFDPKTAERLLAHPKFRHVLEVVRPVTEDDPKPRVTPSYTYVTPVETVPVDTNPLPVIEEN